MKKALTFALAFSYLALGLSRSSFAQDNVTRTAVSVTAESGSREQDKLNGPVRRVRVETARIIPKNGNWVEAPREVLGVVTYDQAGRKIDSVVYHVDSRSPLGKEQYLYDRKGNVVELTLRSSDGSMLSKESYNYEFDQLGNWTKMSTSVAVYENGKIVFEPTGITYRTISYYYSKEIEKLNALSPTSKGVSAPSTSSTLLPSSTVSSTNPSRHSTPNAQVSATSQPLAEAAANAKTEMIPAPVSVPPASESPVATSSEIRTTPNDAPATNVVQHVTEEDLRNAAIELPKPEYSDAALQAQASGQVTVQILVDETGHVMTAQATSGHPLLGPSAEAAARKARFSLARVSSGTTKVYGVISYDFVPPKPASEALPVTSATADRNPPKREAIKPEARPIPESETIVELKPKAPVNYSEVARSSYDKGVTFQAAGRYAEAAEAFDRTIKADPNDAKAYARLGMAYTAMEKHKDAIVVFKMALQIDKSVLGAPAYYTWGHSYLKLEKSSEAVSAFKQALKITQAEAIDPEQKQPQRYPTLEQLHYGLGIAFLNLRRFGESVSELKKVVTLNPKDAEAHYALAIAYLSNGNRRQAEVHQRTLSSLDRKLAEKLDSAMAGGELPPCFNVLCHR